MGNNKKIIPYLKKIPAVQFTYDLWRAGSLTELGIKQREWSIDLHKNYVRDMAVGYVEGEKLHIRPKIKHVAVMFYYNDSHFWTHLTNKEFIICFPNYEKYLQNIDS